MRHPVWSVVSTASGRRNAKRSDKPLPITKVIVWNAYQQVIRTGKAAGVDDQRLDDFNKDLENNLFKLWNRMT